VSALVTASILTAAQAQFYQAGDVIEEFALVNRATREPVRLSDFTGQILFLEWFAWWCPFCQAAAPQVAEGIVEHYRVRGGNPAGIPVVHVAVNLQPNQESQTQNFVDRAGFELVAEDFGRALAGRFQAGGQPIFAIINGVANSPSHRLWELLLHQDGYGQSQSPIAAFRSAIDAVQAAPAVEPVRITAQPEGKRVVEGRGATLEVGATGSLPLAYQWRKDGLDLPGANSPRLRLDSVTAADTGSYTVQISNAAGSVLSESAQIEVVRWATEPARLDPPRLLSNDRLRLILHGASNRSYAVELSIDLDGWTRLVEVVTTGPVHELELPIGAEAAARGFFRIVSP